LFDHFQSSKGPTTDRNTPSANPAQHIPANNTNAQPTYRRKESASEEEKNTAAMATGVDAKLLKSTKFPPEFNQKVDMQKVNVQVMKK
jgi:hypothetical protein